VETDEPSTVGHMSFGKTDAFRDQSNYANQIFARYHETIAAQFYGHRLVSFSSSFWVIEGV
jgi:hypothetical protein